MLGHLGVILYNVKSNYFKKKKINFLELLKKPRFYCQQINKRFFLFSFILSLLLFANSHD